MRNIRLISLISSAILLLSACSGGGDGGSDGPVVPATSCGTIKDGVYVNPVSDSDGEVVYLASISEVNTIIVQNQFGEDLLVRILGLTPDAQGKLSSAKSFISSFSSGGLLFVRSGCKDVTIGEALVGSFYNQQGQNLAEELVKKGLAAPKDTDVCGGERIAQCLKTIENTNPLTAGELSRFLWKPVSDSDGALAIHTGPFGTTVIVNGVTGTNQGPGNGYGSLARFPRSGCAYGTPTIQVIDSNGLPYTVGGRTSFSVPSGCGRFCVEDGNGNVFACTKN